jgi:hypothetical protein
MRQGNIYRGVILSTAKNLLSLEPSHGFYSHNVL